MKRIFVLSEHTPMGDRKTILTLFIDDKSFSGRAGIDSAPGQRAEIKLSSCVLKSNGLSFQINAGGMLKTYEVEFAGSTIKGEATFVTGEFAGTRTPFDGYEVPVEDGKLICEAVASPDESPALVNPTLVVDGTVKRLTADPASYQGPGKIVYPQDQISNEKMQFRTAVYGDETGVVESASVKEAFVGGKCEGSELSGATVRAEDVNFNAVILNNGNWNVRDLNVKLQGEVGNDFKGLGAAVLAMGNTEATFDNLDIDCQGPAKTTVLVKNDSKVLIKNSRLRCADGDLPADYVGTVNPDKMKSAPWMLGVNGNARTTNIEDKASATYFNSSIEAMKWGVLSTDDNKGVVLTAINCTVQITGGVKPLDEIKANASQGKFDFYNDQIADRSPFSPGEWQSTNKPSGYGTYSIGGTLVTLAGCTVVAADYVAIAANGPASLTLTSSDSSSIASAYGYLDILHQLEARKTLAFSRRFGIMYHSGQGNGVTTIEKGSVLCTAKTAFQVKGCGTIINVDDANIYAGNGIILQVMDNDDAGIDVSNLETTTNYIENHIQPTATETSSNAPSNAGSGSVFATFANMTLNGDIFNASGWEAAKNANPLDLADYENDVSGGASSVTNLSVVLDNVVYTGLISTSEARHNLPVITYKEYDQIGEVSNTVCIPENAGLIVSLKNSTIWNLTGTGYLTSLTVDESSRLGNAEVWVNGVKTSIEAGKTYVGVIKIIGTASKGKDHYVDLTKLVSGVKS